MDQNFGICMINCIESMAQRQNGLMDQSGGFLKAIKSRKRNPSLFSGCIKKRSTISLNYCATG